MSASRYIGPGQRYRWTPVFVGGLMLLCAALHQGQLQWGIGNYTRSPLIAVEAILLLAGALAAVVWAAWSVALLALRRWRELGLTALQAALGLGLLALAVALDAATLIYAT